MDHRRDSSPHFNLKPFSLDADLLAEILNVFNDKNNKVCSKSSNKSEFAVCQI